jgi:beta-glucosidase
MWMKYSAWIFAFAQQGRERQNPVLASKLHSHTTASKVSCLIVPFLMLTTASALAQQYLHPFNDPKLPTEKRIDNILSLMSTDEKIACLGVQTAVLRLGIPSYGGSEGLHGVVQRSDKGAGGAIPTTQFPQPPGMGETWDPELVQEAAGIEGRDARFISQTEAYHRKILMLWGPQADLARDPRWGRSEEVYGEDPFFNGTMVVSFIRGLQGNDPNYWQAAALLKHFLANSNEDGRTSSSSNFDQRLFWEYYSVPFRMGFQQGGAKAVMASYNAWNGVPMAINPILKSILVDQWHLDVISSDGGAVKDLVTQRKLFPTQKAAVVACLKSGINQFLDTYKDETTQALKEGLVTESEIDALLRPKFRITLKLGLLDPPALTPFANTKDSPLPWEREEEKAISKKMALESVVLLKNSASLLPLQKASLKSIAVIGPLANVVRWDWYGGKTPYTVTPLDAIRNLAGPTVKINTPADDSPEAAVDAARSSDVAIVVVGNDPTCGPNMQHDFRDDASTVPCAVASDGREGRDRASITLEQEELVKKAYAANPKTVMVLISSFPYAINWSQDNVPAILHMAHSSQDEGTALAAVLFGDYNPGGHLVTTWPKSLEQLPPMMDYDIRNGHTYLYFKGQPLYPFGFGLSYTTFAYSHLNVSSKNLAKNGTVTVTLNVKNTGPQAGDEVVQLYVSHPKSKVDRPREELKGFQRVTLQPSQVKTVKITLRSSDLVYWNEKDSRLEVEAEPLRLAVGSSSADLKVSTTISVR